MKSLMMIPVSVSVILPNTIVLKIMFSIKTIVAAIVISINPHVPRMKYLNQIHVTVLVVLLKLIAAVVISLTHPTVNVIVRLLPQTANQTKPLTHPTVNVHVH
jgi:hypothetical protein